MSTTYASFRPSAMTTASIPSAISDPSAPTAMPCSTEGARLIALALLERGGYCLPLSRRQAA